MEPDLFLARPQFKIKNSKFNIACLDFLRVALGEVQDLRVVEVARLGEQGDAGRVRLLDLGADGVQAALLAQQMLAGGESGVGPVRAAGRPGGWRGG